MSARHRDALAHVLYGVGETGGFVLLTGEVGTGKTTIIRSLLEQLPDNTDVALVFNPTVDAEELLATVCEELDTSYVQDRHSLKTLTDSLHHFLLKNHARGRNTVLLIDEAQHLKVEVLEQIRLLTNLETNTKKLVQIILVGQPELRNLLNKPELRQLAQRITTRCQLKPLDFDETDNYIRHRLQVAGFPTSRTLFPRAIVKSIHKASRGIPRLINVLCDRMLLGTYGQNKTEVDKDICKQAMVEVLGEEDEFDLPRLKRPKPVLASVSAGLVLLAALILWQWIPAPGAKQVPAAVDLATDLTTELPNEVAVEKDAGQSQPVEQSPQLPLNQLTQQPTPEVQARPPLNSLLPNDETLAINQLLVAIGAQTQLASGCELGESTAPTLRCQRLTVDSWQELRQLNRPAVLELLSQARVLHYAPLMGFDQTDAFVLADGELTKIPIVEIGEQWTGETTLLWQVSEHYKAPVAIGNRGPVVSWLAKQFATLDQQETTLAKDQFNEALKERIILFQRDNKLEVDGVAGMKTLLKLDEQVNSPVTLLEEWPESNSPIEVVSQGIVNNLESN